MSKSQTFPYYLGGEKRRRRCITEDCLTRIWQMFLIRKMNSNQNLAKVIIFSWTLPADHLNICLAKLCLKSSWFWPTLTKDYQMWKKWIQMFILYSLFTSHELQRKEFPFMWVMRQCDNINLNNSFNSEPAAQADLKSGWVNIYDQTWQ